MMNSFDMRRYDMLVQVREFGNVLGEAGCALLMWRYDAAFMADAENARAFKDLGSRMASLPRKSCRRP